MSSAAVQWRRVAGANAPVTLSATTRIAPAARNRDPASSSGGMDSSP